MTFKYNKNINDQIDQVTKNIDQLFGLFKTVKKQVEGMSAKVAIIHKRVMRR